MLGKIKAKGRKEMNELKIFENREFGQIRTVQLNNETYFVGKDVARALGYGEGKSLNNAISNHVEEEDKGVTEIMTPGGKQNMTVVNESGLYALIFSSKLESAKRFKHWVTSEVLPELRKNGQYQMPNFSKEMQAILLLDTRTVKMEKRLDKLEFEIPLYGSESDELSGHVKRKGVEILGGKKSEAYSDDSIRKKVYTDIYSQIKREFGLYQEDGKTKSYKALKRKYLYEAHELIDKYEAPLHLQETIKEANAQISLDV